MRLFVVDRQQSCERRRLGRRGPVSDCHDQLDALSTTPFSIYSDRKSRFTSRISILAALIDSVRMTVPPHAAGPLYVVLDEELGDPFACSNIQEELLAIIKEGLTHSIPPRPSGTGEDSSQTSYSFDNSRKSDSMESLDNNSQSATHLRTGASRSQWSFVPQYVSRETQTDLLPVELKIAHAIINDDEGFDLIFRKFPQLLKEWSRAKASDMLGPY